MHKINKKGYIINRELVVSILWVLATIFVWWQWNRIAENVALWQTKQLSKEYCSDFHKTIMNTKEFYNIRQYIDKWEHIPNQMKKLSFIDNFEWLWDKYCDEMVYLKDIKTYKYLFQKACTNNEIVNIFQNKKNSFSKICLDLWFDEWMWKFFNWTEKCKVLK